MKTILILFTLIFVISPAFGQEEERKPVSQKDSLRLQNYKVISLTTGDNSEGSGEQTNNVNVDATSKVKSLASQSEEYSNIPTLDQLVHDYWNVQEDIKEAKLNNDTNLLDQFESNSSQIQLQYIQEYEGLNVIDVNPEYTKLYNLFLKDNNTH